MLLENDWSWAKLRMSRRQTIFFFSSRRRHTILQGDWSSDVCSSDLMTGRLPTSLLGSLEPVSVSEELSAALLLDRVEPSYPQQALRAGLQGPVVLQAWIARDGTIRELKLMRGSFVLGQAAYEAVKQWRYKPYVRNGHAVEAQTYVTVDFRLP